MKVNVLDIALLKTNEEATVIEKFSEENYLLKFIKMTSFLWKMLDLMTYKKLYGKVNLHKPTKPRTYEAVFFLFTNIKFFITSIF